MATSKLLTDPDSNQDDVAKTALAQETQMPLDTVAKLYDEEFSTLAQEARITQFLGVLVTRRVRLKLREH